MGRSLEKLDPKLQALCYEVGKQIALHNCILVNGACFGVPYECSKGAKDADGFVVGISPAMNVQEHTMRYKFPTDMFDLIVYSGYGFKGRNVLNVSTADIVLVIGGASGTLNEFSIAYDDGKVIGVLLGSGGITDHLKHIIEVCNKNTGAKIVYDRDPHKLVSRVLEVYKTHQEKYSDTCPP